MDEHEKNNLYSEQTEHPAPASEKHEEKQDIPVVTTRRLRDRELLKRRKEEAQEKDTFQEQARNKRQRKGTGRGRKKQQVAETEPEPEPHPEPVPEREAHQELEEQTEISQEHVQHHEDPDKAVTEDVTLLIQKEEDGHIASWIPSSVTVEQESAPVVVVEEPELLTFPLDAGHEEPQYYTPLL
ncbi:hemogen [Pelodytes ibericus]